MDVKQAERKLDYLERHLNAVDQGRASSGPGGSGGPGSGGNSYNLAPKGPSGPYSYDLASKHSYSLKPSAKKASGSTLEDLKKEAQVKFGLDDDLARFTRIERIKKFAQTHIDAAKKASLPGFKQALDNVLNMGKAAVPYALAYEGAAKAIKLAPSVASGLSAALGNPGGSQSVIGELDKLRSSIQFIESYITSIASATSKTYQTAEAVAYVTGRVPNIGLTFQYERKAELYEDQLNKRLGNFKTDNLAASVGASIAEMTRQGLNK
jgi:hypothetical protein